MRVEDIFYGDPFESGLAMPPGFMGGVAVPEPQETPTPVPTEATQQEQEEAQIADVSALSIPAQEEILARLADPSFGESVA